MITLCIKSITIPTERQTGLIDLKAWLSMRNSLETQVESKRMKNIYSSNNNQNKTGVAALLSEK